MNNDLYQQAYQYRISYAHSVFTIYLNDITLAVIYKPSKGRWPMIVEMQGQNYLIAKLQLFKNELVVQQMETDISIATIKMPLLSTVSKRVGIHFKSGSSYNWFSKNYFSYHWVIADSQQNIMEGIQHLDTRKVEGIITMRTMANEQLRLLLAIGLFLSMLRKSRLSFGIRGLRMPVPAPRILH